MRSAVTSHAIRCDGPCNPLPTSVRIGEGGPLDIRRRAAWSPCWGTLGVTTGCSFGASPSVRKRGRRPALCPRVMMSNAGGLGSLTGSVTQHSAIRRKAIINLLYSLRDVVTGCLTSNCGMGLKRLNAFSTALAYHGMASGDRVHTTSMRFSGVGFGPAQGFHGRMQDGKGLRQTRCNFQASSAQCSTRRHFMQLAGCLGRRSVVAYGRCYTLAKLLGAGTNDRLHR